MIPHDIEYRQGATRLANGATRWCVWAPHAKQVDLLLWHDRQMTERPLQPIRRGHHALTLPDIADGQLYSYRVLSKEGGDGADMFRWLPDPASHWQPQGVHGPSAVFHPTDFKWTDHAWPGVPLDELILYELHVGTFTAEGTFDAIIPRLPELKALGVTAIELMPIAQFAGERNWGYDATFLNAVQNTYGGPRALQRLVNAAHRHGLGIILDVVYNHLGPEGNYLASFAPYFSDVLHSPWGPVPNFDSHDSDAVRRFVTDNARMWARDYHLDGLRLDAANVILDRSSRHIASDIREVVAYEAASLGQKVHVFAEAHDNDIRWIDSPERRGHGLAGMWNDDFHHSMRAVLGGDRDGYYAAYGAADDVVKTFNDVFVYDGKYSVFWRRVIGAPARDTYRSRFCVYVQNHDQIGNRVRGDRMTTTLAPPAQRLAAGLLLISPFTPLLFMGEEYGEKRPFPFFSSFTLDPLILGVREGRVREFAHMGFRWSGEPFDPQSVDTFLAAKLAWEWPDGSEHAQRRRLYLDLIRARKQWPALRDRNNTTARLHWPDVEPVVVETSPPPRDAVLVIERGRNGALVAVANLSGRALPFEPEAVEGRELLMSTEEARYGGARRDDQPVDGRLLPYELLLFGDGAWKI